MKALWTLLAVVVLIGATDEPAFACSCAKIASFDEVVRAATVVVVGRVTSIAEIPPAVPDAQTNVTVVRPPFRGQGITLAVAAVPKGKVDNKKIRVWNPIYGECGGALRGVSRGMFVVIALERLADAPGERRASWGLGFAPAEIEHLVARPSCGPTLQVLGDEHAANEAMARRDYQRALTEYQKLLAADPTDLEAAAGVGSALLRLGRYKEAAQTFERALPPTRSDSLVPQELALAYLALGEEAQAEAILRRYYLPNVVPEIVAGLRQQLKGLQNRP